MKPWGKSPSLYLTFVLTPVISNLRFVPRLVGWSVLGNHVHFLNPSLWPAGIFTTAVLFALKPSE